VNFQEKWKNFLVEVSSADAMQNLRGSAGDKILNAWAYDMLQIAKENYDNAKNARDGWTGASEELEELEEIVATYALMMPGKKFRNRYGPELKGMIADTIEETVIPQDITDNQKGAAILWIVRLLRKNVKVKTTMAQAVSSLRDHIVSTEASHVLDTALLDIDASDMTNYLFSVNRSLEMFFQYSDFMGTKDLNRIQSPDQLLDITDKAWPDIKAYQEKQKFLDAAEGTEVFRDDDEWYIAAIHNKGAACELGKGTEWCTAAPGLDYFAQYYKPGDPLFVFVPKDDPENKFQFHYGTEQFMDRRDYEIPDEKIVQLHQLLSKTKARQKYKIISTYDEVLLARDPNISEEEATRIYKDGNPERLRDLFANPGTPPSLLTKAEETMGVTSGDKKRRVRGDGGMAQFVVTGALIKNPSTPTETVVRILDKFNLKKNPNVRKLTSNLMYISLLKHPNMPLDIVKKIFFGKSDYNIDFSWKAREEILKHPNLDEAFLNDIVERMSALGHDEIADLKQIMAHPNSSPQIIDKIVSMPARFSEKPLPSGRRAKLSPAPAEGEDVALAVIENPKTSPKTLMKVYKIQKELLDAAWERAGMTDGNWETNKREKLLKKIESSPNFPKKENFHKKWKKKLKEQTTLLGLSNKYNNLGQAINDKRVVIIFYEGDNTVSRGARAIEPVVLGTHYQSGNPVVRAWQVQGASDTPDNLPGWRMFRVDRIARLRMTDNTFDTPRPQYDPNDDHIASQDATAQFGASLQETKNSRLKLAIYEQKVVKQFKKWKKFVKEQRSRKEKDLQVYSALKKLAKAKEQERFSTEKEKAYAQRALEKGNETYIHNIHEIFDNVMMARIPDYFDIDIGKLKVAKYPDEFRKKNLSVFTDVVNEIPNDNPLKSNKIVDLLGAGAYGVVFELDNGHALKLFSGGIRGAEEELEWYEEMKSDQFTGASRRGELAVFGSGNLETSNFDVAWAEIGQVVPLKMWARQKGASPLIAAAHFDDVHTLLQNLAFQYNPNVHPDDRDIEPIKENPNSKDKIQYVKYLLEIIHKSNVGLPKESEHGYGTATLAKMLKEVLEIALKKGDHLVFDEETADVHAGNIGFHLADDQPVVFDR
tara:strand:- start:91535 stop:94843 length:3309 start_codon:yes stop_codon:yes gene_type:complete